MSSYHKSGLIIVHVLRSRSNVIECAWIVPQICNLQPTLKYISISESQFLARKGFEELALFFHLSHYTVNICNVNVHSYFFSWSTEPGPLNSIFMASLTPVVVIVECMSLIIFCMHVTTSIHHLLFCVLCYTSQDVILLIYWLKNQSLVSVMDIMINEHITISSISWVTCSLI